MLTDEKMIEVMRHLAKNGSSMAGSDKLYFELLISEVHRLRLELAVAEKKLGDALLKQPQR